MIKKRQYNLIFSFLIFFVMCFFLSSLLADIAELKDTTILVGKVTKNNKKTIVFKNAYGEFTIQKQIIKRLYITQHFKEDIRIFKQLGKKANEDSIRKNYYAGMDKKNNYEAEESNKFLWFAHNDYHEISFSSSSMFITGKLKEVIENGFSINLIYTSPLNVIPTINLKKWMPRITGELSYQHFQQDQSRINGVSVLAGPSWNISFFSTEYGSIEAGVLTGFSVFDVTGETTSQSTTTFTNEVFTGYSITFDHIAFFSQFKYLYVYDRDIDLNAIGFSIGARYLL